MSDKLTLRQAQVLTELCETGCRKVTAHRLGVSQQSLAHVIRAACRRLNVRTDMMAVLTWDRRHRGRV